MIRKLLCAAVFLAAAALVWKFGAWLTWRVERRLFNQSVRHYHAADKEPNGKGG